jgi:predicted HTH domain antitoxin
MQITIQLPDDLGQRPEAGREALEALVIEGYRAGLLSQHQAGQMLEMSRFEFEAFLKARQVKEQAYTSEDLDEDMETFRRLRAEGIL